MFHKVRDTIQSGAIGEIGTISTSFGGVQAWMFRSGSHLLDAMTFFTQATPLKVSAHLEDGYDDWDEYRGSGGGNATERDPGATGYVVFDNGVRAFYSCLKTTPDSYRDTVITGSKGYLSFKFDGEFAELHMTDPAHAYNTLRTTLTPDAFRSRGIEAAYREIIDNIANGTTSSSPARDARKTVQILMGFLKSHQEGGRLVDVPA
jgi:predicted dehydrogenase